MFYSDDRALNSKVNKFERKVESIGNRGSQGSKSHLRTSNNSAEFKKVILNPINSSTISSAILVGRSHKKTNSGSLDINKISDKNSKLNVGRFNNVRGANYSVSIPSDDQLTKPKDYCAKKFINELDFKFKNYQLDYNKDNCVYHQDYKTRSMGNLTPRLPNDPASTFQHARISQYSHDENNGSKNNSNNSVYTTARNTLEQQNFLPKMAPINFPPLRAPQSIVNVRHPFVTESRIKHNDVGVSNGLKSKSAINTLMQLSLKEIEPGRQTYHNFGTSPLNIAANMSPYPRPDSFPQPTLASLLFSDSGQFSQSASSYSTNQLNQFQTYDHTSYHTNTPVIPHFSDNSLTFPQYDSTTFVQPNHYSAADLTSNQFQYQTAPVGQIQDSPLFIQSLQSPIALTDQYATSNYARALRTELIHRLPRPPRFNK